MSENESSIFHRLILPSTLHDNKLKIPGKFVKNLRSDLSSVATLTTPNGHVWSVILQKFDDKVWFRQGWNEFVQHQSIRVGYLLVFTYKGNSNFTVNIFDTASAEIKYTHGNQFPVSNSGECPKYEQNYSVGDNTSFNLEYHKGTRGGLSTRDIGVQCNFSDLMSSTYEMRLHSFGQQTEAPRKRKRGSGTTRSVKLDELSFFPGCFGQQTEAPRKRKRGSGTTKKGSEVLSPETEPTSGNFLRKWRVITPEEKERVLNASKMFESENPFCRVFLRRSYVYKGIGLHMPSSFAEKYLSGVMGFVTLQVSSGEKWPVRCMWRDGSAKLSKGWLEFVRDNHLEEGDVCVFELIKSGEAVLKVTIFRLPQEITPLNQFPKEHLNRTLNTNQLAAEYDINGPNL